MENMRRRAKKAFPMVLLTLLSIVQALALEFLWDHSRHREDLFHLTLEVIPGWLQIAATFNLIVIIWLMYAGILMRFRWTPTTMDSVFPFGVGVVQFLLIDLMGPDHFALWVIFLSLTFGLLVVIDHIAMRRARRDPGNAEFFDRYEPATIKDFIPQILLGLSMLAAGIGLQVTGHEGWVKVAVLVAIFIAIGYETHKTAVYWRDSMGCEND